MLLLALSAADWMLSFIIKHIGRISAHHAPSIAAGGQAHLVLNLHRWNIVLLSLIHRIQFNVGNSFIQPLSIDLVIFGLLFVSGLWLVRLNRVVGLVAARIGLFGFALQGVNSGLVQADIIDHVLHDTVDVLVLVGERHLERVIEIIGCGTTRSA